MFWGEPSFASKIVKIAHQQTLGLLLSVFFFWTVTVWPLLRFLTISRVIELRFKWNLSCWKDKTWGYKFYVWGEPSSASKIVKITHQQTLGMLLSNCYCPFLNCYCLTSPQIFNYIWSYRTQIYSLTSRHQFIIDFKTTHKTMFRISYSIQIKVLIPPFLSNDSRPSPLIFLFNFFSY
jgi:hypothetical protein